MRLSQSPKSELTNIKSEKKRYDREFLLSLRNLATERPINLAPIPNITIDGVSVNSPLSF